MRVAVVFALFAALAVVIASQPAAPKADGCSICELVVNFIETSRAANQTEAKILEGLETVCGELPSPFSTICNATVAKYFGAIIGELQSGTPADQVCAQIHLCTSVAPKPQADACSICELVVNYIETSRAANQTEEKILNGLEMICSELPQPFGGICNETVSKYFGAIISELQNGTPADQVCAQIKLCTSTVAVVKKVLPAKPKADVCSICELVVNFIETSRAANQTEAKILEGLETVCGELPSPFSTMCNATVAKYFGAIIGELQSGTPADQVCAQIRLCTSVIPKPKADACSICELVVNFIETSRAANQTEEKILNGLEMICSELPQPFGGICNQTVSKYFGAIIAELQNGTPADQVCAQIKLCTSAAPKVVVVAPKPAADLCSICELVVNFVETNQKANATEAEIMAGLQKVCAALPQPFGDMCNATVSKYIGAIVSELQNGTPADQVCAQIKLCTSAAPVTKTFVISPRRKISAQ